MVLTDIKIRKFFDEGPMKAVCSITFDDCLAVHDVKVIYAKDKYFVVMPSKKNPDGTFRDIIHPINREFRNYIESSLINYYLEELPKHEAMAEEETETESADAFVI